jgi:hypothetical protein
MYLEKKAAVLSVDFLLSKSSILLMVVLTYAYVTLSVWPTLMFDSDSWAYFELAKSISGDFYRFTTFRSYISDEYSASFPFGYPVVLHSLFLAFGSHPWLAVILNISVALATPLLAEAYVRRVHPDLKHVGLVSGFILVLSAPYVIEVFAGKALPLTSLVFILTLVVLEYAVQNRSFWLSLGAGLLAGSSVLIRFDALVPVFFLSVYLLARTRSIPITSCYLLGVVLGLSPWMGYSYLHFGKLLVSDNSWVALSAEKEWMTGYPAEATRTIFTHPAEWFSKIAYNSAALSVRIVEALVRYWPATVLAVLAGIFLKTNFMPFRGKNDSGLMYALFSWAMGLSAYVLTGYRDPRYYLFISFLFTAMVFSAIYFACQERRTAYFARLLSFAVIFHLVFTNAIYYHGWAGESPAWRERDLANGKLMDQLYSCHRNEKHMLYVFVDTEKQQGAYIFAARYGATFGLPSALPPLDWTGLDEKVKDDFRKKYGPIRIIDMPSLRAFGTQSIGCNPGSRT